MGRISQFMQRFKPEKFNGYSVSSRKAIDQQLGKTTLSSYDNISTFLNIIVIFVLFFNEK